LAEDHACEGMVECHPFREFEGVKSSSKIKMLFFLLSATGVTPWISTENETRKAVVAN